MTKGQVVVEARRDLLADDQQNAVMPSLESVLTGTERRMVRKHEDVDAALSRRVENCRNRCAPVKGIGGVQVDDGGVVFQMQGCFASFLWGLHYPACKIASGQAAHSAVFRQKVLPVFTIRA